MPASPKCISCGNGVFEINPANQGPITNLKGGARLFSFVQCSKCGAVIGVVDRDNDGTACNLVRKLAERLNIRGL